MTTMTRVGGMVMALLAFSGDAAAARESPLADAVMRQDGTAARALLAAGADVNVAQPDGATALHWAVHWDDPELVDRLLRAGAAVNATNDLGVPPLWLASLNAS